MPAFARKYTKISRGNGTIVNFVPVAGAELALRFCATVQPLDARAVEALEDGLRSRARFACFTREKLVTFETGGVYCDLVLVNGERYEVHGGYDDGDFGAPIAYAREYILAEPSTK